MVRQFHPGDSPAGEDLDQRTDEIIGSAAEVSEMRTPMSATSQPVPVTPSQSDASRWSPRIRTSINARTDRPAFRTEDEAVTKAPLSRRLNISSVCLTLALAPYSESGFDELVTS